jgi:UDP-N-acetylglucosamine 2-epimerase (non-hydrolysing)
MKNVIVTPPLGYIEFMNLVVYCKFIMTDSGGIQDECAYLQKPCITLREDTERPVTVLTGYNHLTGKDQKKIFKAIKIIEKKGNGVLEIEELKVPFLKYWDGQTAKRIVKILTHDWEYNHGK